MTAGPTVNERKAHILARADLRAILKNAKAAFKTDKDTERVPCPLCGAGGFGTLKAKSGTRLWKCYGGSCGGGNAIDFVMVRDRLDFIAALRSLEQDIGGLASFTPEKRAELARRRAIQEKRAAEAEAKRRAEAITRLKTTLDRMAPLTADTLAWKYLEDRGLDMAALAPRLAPGACGFVADAQHPDDRRATQRPALIVRVTRFDAETGRIDTCAMQAIFLDPRAQAAPPAFVAIYGGARPWRGASSRIWRPIGMANAKIATGFWQSGACRLTDIPDDGRIGLAEGFEKSLAVMQLYGIACWPVMYAKNFASCAIEPGVRAIEMFVDNNRPRIDKRTGKRIETGGVSYEAAKERRRLDARATRIWRPSAGEDFSDYLVAWRAGLIDEQGAPKVSRAELNKALGA